MTNTSLGIKFIDYNNKDTEGSKTLVINPFLPSFH